MPPPRRPSASILVPVRDLPGPTRRCLESVRRHTAGAYEVIVVDNASAGPTRGLLAGLARDWPALRVARNATNRPFAAAINQAARLARAPRLVWLNNDAVATPEWLARLTACLDAAPAAGACGPCTNDPACGPGPRPAARPAWDDLPRLAAAWSLRHDGRRREARRLAGFCLAVSRRAAERVGPLDERFRWGEEDDDYCFRLRQAGFRLWQALDVLVYHAGGLSRGRWSAPRRRALAAANRGLLLHKWGAPGGRFRAEALAEARGR